jgi:hypothetical protein
MARYRVIRKNGTWEKRMLRANGRMRNVKRNERNKDGKSDASMVV